MQAELIAVGATVELVGIILGALEIRSTRRATTGFLNRSRNVYLSGHARLGLSLTSSAQLTASGSGPQPMPTIDDRVRALESRVSAREEKMQTQVKALRDELEERWRTDIATVATLREHADRDLVEALESFVRELGAGRWRRYAAVAFLLVGAAVQAAAGLSAAL